MPVLDCPILKENWAHETSGHDCVAGAAAKALQAKGVDTGPWEPGVREILSYQHLGGNWDGYGAEVPGREVLESAIGLAYTYHQNGVEPPHRVAPGVAGSVIFEWQYPDGTYATVEIDRPLHAEVMLMEPGTPPKHWTLPTQ